MMYSSSKLVILPYEHPELPDGQVLTVEPAVIPAVDALVLNAQAVLPLDEFEQQ